MRGGPHAVAIVLILLATSIVVALGAQVALPAAASTPPLTPTSGPSDTSVSRIDDVVQRVTDGLVTLYAFGEGNGTTVQDVSGVGAPLDLEIADPGAVRWRPGGGLMVRSPTVIASVEPADKIVAALQESGELSIEAWFTPETLDQTGPARIVTVSSDHRSRNFTLGQDNDSVEARVRTTATSENAAPGIATDPGTLADELTHVTYTRTVTGDARMHVNGQVVVSDALPGDLSNWDATYRLGLGDELNGDRPWVGTLRLVAVYSRALTDSEVSQNYAAGPDGVTEVPWPERPPEPEPGPVPEPVPVPDGEQRVVFTAEPSADCSGPCGQQTAIWQMAADGSDASALTVPGAAFDRFARWSPDGTRVAFTRTAHAGGGAEVYVQSAGASSARRVSDTTAANGGAGCSPDTTVPVWAPDATRLAFACATDDARQSRVYVVAADGSAQSSVAATATAADTAPTWSPTSDRLAFARTDTAVAYGAPGRVSIWTADVDAGGPSNVRVLVSGPAAAGHPAWSPAGDEVAYVSTDELDLRTALRAVPATGGASRLVYDAPDDQLVTLYAPVWSPDAARLAVAVGDGLTTSTITVVNATTRHATPVTPTDTLAYTPTWSPTSTALICDLITPSGAHHVATVTTDGTYQALPLPARHTYDANWGS